LVPLGSYYQLKMKETKRQVLPSGLWVVATPIGNLEDVTPRALQALSEADLILCEDTRRTRILIQALSLGDTPRHLERFDAHTPSGKIENWIERLNEGMNIAIVTDAGTPGVSDPGAALVSRAIHSKIRVTPIPGVSAVSTLISVCGFQAGSFTFRGFFPRTESHQKKELELMASDSQVFIWFESPQRITKTLNILNQLYPNASVTVAKEMTKIYEQFFSGTASDVLEQVSAEIKKEGSVGEWCLAVKFQSGLKGDEHADSVISHVQAPWFKALQCLLQAGVSPSESAKLVSQNFDVSKNLVYKLALDKKKNERA
jgi:16S rRNA (cytidine1402-2'-O)-methyltransferase